MIEPFKRAEVPGIGPEGYFTSVPNQAAEWFFTEPTVARREYKGQLMRHTENGWEFWQPRQWHKVADNSKLLAPAFWQAVYPKVGYFQQALQVLTNRWRDCNSPFKYVQEFEDAESPLTDEYELGEYWLVKGEPCQLIPVNKAEQLSNINALEIHEIGDPEKVFNALQAALAPMREDVYGVIFTASDGTRARVRVGDFDWTEYDVEP